MTIQRTEQIKELLEKALQPSQLEVTDDSAQHIGHAGAASGAGHFTVKIAAAAFKDKSLIASHRLVYQALDSMMHSEIHALRIVII